MDNSTIGLFLEDNTSQCLSNRLFWDSIQSIDGWAATLRESINWHEECFPDIPHYWSNDSEKLEKLIQDFTIYSDTRKHLANETLNIRNMLLTMAESIQLFGNSVINVIDSTAAGTNTKNFTQAQVDQFDSSLLNIEDSARVQSFSSHMDSLRDATSSALETVSTFQSKISDLKLLLVNSLRPAVDGALFFNNPELVTFTKEVRERVDIMKINNTSQDEILRTEKLYSSSLTTLVASARGPSPLAFYRLKFFFMSLSASIFRVQPALSKFEVLWIETRSFIKNSKENADTIQNVRMLKVFKTRMQKIITDWNNVKLTLGAQPTAIE